MAGAMTECPEWTVRIAASRKSGVVSLVRKPAAPAWMARTTASSCWIVVKTMILVPALPGVATIFLVAVIPSMTGIRMSIRSTSGLAAWTSSTAASPLVASPTRSRSAWLRRIILSPALNSGWSSASAIRIGIPVTATLRPGPEGQLSRGRIPGTCPDPSRAGTPVFRTSLRPGPFRPTRRRRRRVAGGQRRSASEFEGGGGPDQVQLRALASVPVLEGVGQALLRQTVDRQLLRGGQVPRLACRLDRDGHAAGAQTLGKNCQVLNLVSRMVAERRGEAFDQPAGFDQCGPG